MKLRDAKKKLEELNIQQQLEERESHLNRARSVTVGTCFGGTTELTMRGDGKHLWCTMQPTEVIELIHQLAANVGCHIAIKPRDDFSSWREWRISEAEKKHLQGHAPFVNDMAVFQRLGSSGFDQQQAEQTVADWLKEEEYEYVNGGATRKSKKEPKNEAVATQKPANKRAPKRTATAS
jgi:hypothetical protein